MNTITINCTVNIYPHRELEYSKDLHLRVMDAKNVLNVATERLLDTVGIEENGEAAFLRYRIFEAFHPQILLRSSFFFN